MELINKSLLSVKPIFNLFNPVSVTLVILTRNNLVINTKYSILKYKINHFLHLFHENIIICLHYHILSIFRRHFARLSTKQTSSCFSGFLHLTVDLDILVFFFSMFNLTFQPHVQDISYTFV